MQLYFPATLHTVDFSESQLSEDEIAELVAEADKQQEQHKAYMRLHKERIRCKNFMSSM